MDLQIDSPRWDLPAPIIQLYQNKGIERFFEWQAECLSIDGVLDQTRNLLYSAPTSAGKSLVGDILLYKTVLEKKKKVIIVLPYIAIVEERFKTLSHFLEPFEDVSVVSYAGINLNHNVTRCIDTVDVAICTLEKANKIINE